MAVPKNPFFEKIFPVPENQRVGTKEDPAEKNVARAKPQRTPNHYNISDPMNILKFIL
jgi:hypothetical protein